MILLLFFYFLVSTAIDQQPSLQAVQTHLQRQEYLEAAEILGQLVDIALENEKKTQSPKMLTIRMVTGKQTRVIASTAYKFEYAKALSEGTDENRTKAVNVLENLLTLDSSNVAYLLALAQVLDRTLRHSAYTVEVFKQALQLWVSELPFESDKCSGITKRKIINWESLSSSHEVYRINLLIGLKESKDLTHLMSLEDLMFVSLRGSKFSEFVQIEKGNVGSDQVQSTEKSFVDLKNGKATSESVEIFDPNLTPTDYSFFYTKLNNVWIEADGTVILSDCAFFTCFATFHSASWHTPESYSKMGQIKSNDRPIVTHRCPVIYSIHKFSNAHYFHWLGINLPHILFSFYFLRPLILENIELPTGCQSKDVKLLIPANLASFAKESLSLLSIKQENLLVIDSFTSKRHVFTTLFALDWRARGGLQSSVERMWLSPPLVLKVLGRALTRSLWNLNKSVQSSASIVFISRKTSRTRALQANDEQKLIEDLKIRYETDSVRLVSAEDYTLSEQISIFKNAKIVIGPHGAGLANVLFMQPHSSLIEFGVTPIQFSFAHLARSMEVHYINIPEIGCPLMSNYTTFTDSQWKILMTKIDEAWKFSNEKKNLKQKIKRFPSAKSAPTHDAIKSILDQKEL